MTRPFLSRFGAALLALCCLGPLARPGFALQGTSAAATADAPGTPFSAERLASLLPPSVYFQGRSAPIQIRNAAGTTLAGGGIVWATLVDTSGYSTSVQDRYQFYFVTESPVQIGGFTAPAGAYGAGFLGDHFLLMDLGGHTLTEGPLQNDPELKRPRPLTLIPVSPSSVKLYLGRHWVLLQTAAHRS